MKAYSQHFAIGTSGVRREVGTIVQITTNFITFRYRRAHSAKRAQIEIPIENILCLREGRVKSEVVFLSPAFDIVSYVSITDVKDTDIPGIKVGTTKQSEKIYFAPSKVGAITLVPRTKSTKPKKVMEPALPKQAKGIRIEKKAW